MSAATITCEGCAEQYPWNERYAGKKVRCRCGQTMVMPASLTPADDDGIDLNLLREPELAPSSLRSVEPAAASRESAGGSSEYELAIPVEKPRAMRRPVVYGDEDPHAPQSSVALALARREDEVVDGHGRSILFPLSVLIVGVALQAVLNIVIADTLLEGIVGFVLLLALQVIVFTPLAVVAMYVTSMIASMSFGPVLPAIGKMAAITIGTGGVADLLYLLANDYLPGGRATFFAMFVIQFICVGLPCAFVYRLENNETSTLVTVIVVTRVAALFTILIMFS